MWCLTLRLSAIQHAVMRTALRVLITAAVTASCALAASPASAWTQIENGGSTTASCSPCYKIQPNVAHRYRTSSATWNSNWDSALATAFAGWNNLRTSGGALNPVWSRTTSTDEAILLGSGSYDPGICAATTPRNQYSASGPIIYYATIALNVNEYHSPTYQNASTCYLTYDLAHEIGHGGEALSHSRVDGNLMVQGAFNRTAPGPDDYNGIRAIYG